MLGIVIHATNATKYWAYSDGFYCVAPLLTS